MLESIGYLNEINSADNLTSVLERLLFHLRIKWLEVADRLQESGLRPRIHHISEFVRRRGTRGEPVAVRSLLGWTLMGPVERFGGDSSFYVWRAVEVIVMRLCCSK